jgi:hypothetical protein
VSTTPRAKSGSLPVAKSAPQPRSEGGPDAPVTDVTIHLLVSAMGTVENAEVVKPVREDLDAEATKVVSKWSLSRERATGGRSNTRLM